MPKPRARVCLQEGLKLDLNRLRREGFVRPGTTTGPKYTSWHHGGEVVAIGMITASMEGDFGWFHLRLLGDSDQWIDLCAEPRNFGGRQWYFACPSTGRSVSVLWMPPGASRFASRQFWGRQIAYASQFETTVHRAHRGQSKIKARLLAGLDPKDWDLPPKPKWMRWSTYNRQVEKFDRYEEALDQRTIRLVARILGRS